MAYSHFPLFVLLFLTVLVAQIEMSVASSATSPIATDNIYDVPKHLMSANTHMLNKWSEQSIQDDSCWLLSSTFVIVTMISGFGLLESGRTATKDEINILVKNAIDVIAGGLTYWLVGFGLSFGKSSYSNPYIGVGSFCFDPEREYYDGDNDKIRGWSYSSFIYQLSYAIMSTAIMSSGTTERVHLRSYIIISLVMPIIHSVPAHWIWAEEGILYQLGVIDWSGAAPVHLCGGVSALVATLYLKPRQNRFGKTGRKLMSNPTKALLGTFMLWTGWFASNTSSAYGVSYGKYVLATKSAVVTIMVSSGGGVAALVISKLVEKKVQVEMVIDGFLASLVSSTAVCPCLSPFSSLLVGAIGSTLAILTHPVLEWAEIDDPVGVVPVHAVTSCFALLMPGFFARIDEFNEEVTRGQNGLLYGGGFSLLGKQLIAILAVVAWSASTFFIVLVSLQHSSMGLRLSKYEEMLGADLREHGMQGMHLHQYVVEKKLTAETLSKILLYYVRWKVRAKKRAEMRRQMAELQQAEGEINGMRMNELGTRTVRGEEEHTISRRKTTHIVAE